jgi:prepilin-type processing-associated H-X9-DG protein
MNCPKCDQPLPPTGVACSQCGADVGWYVRKPEGAEYGPFDLAAVDLCIREARIVPADMVRIGAEGQYLSAQHLLGDRLLTAPPPVAYAPTTGYRQPATADPEGAKKACGIVAFVLVLIVGGIVAISIPAYRRVHTTSAQSACLSNEKQLALGLMMYCQDYDERFPTAGDWQNKLNPYLKNNQLWTCPAYPHEPGYRVNDNLAARVLRDVRQPASTLALWDAGAAVGGFVPGPNTTLLRHNSGNNFAYADGHAKWIGKSSNPGTVTVGAP